MITKSLTRSTSSGSRRTASAMLVSGPIAYERYLAGAALIVSIR